LDFYESPTGAGASSQSTLLQWFCQHYPLCQLQVVQIAVANHEQLAEALARGLDALKLLLLQAGLLAPKFVPM
jgi:hypothetical protein